MGTVHVIFTVTWFTSLETGEWEWSNQRGFGEVRCFARYYEVQTAREYRGCTLSQLRKAEKLTTNLFFSTDSLNIKTPNLNLFSNISLPIWFPNPEIPFVNLLLSLSVSKVVMKILWRQFLISPPKLHTLISQHLGRTLWPWSASPRGKIGDTLASWMSRRFDIEVFWFLGWWFCGCGWRKVHYSYQFAAFSTARWWRINHT